MNEEIVTGSIRKFLARQFPAAKNVGNQDPLLENGIVDSLGILEVVTFLENEFSIVISDEELLPENFASLSSLSTFVRNKTKGTI